MGLTSCSTALLLVNGTPLGIAILAGVLIAMFCGLINGLVANYIGLNPFAATFGMWGMALGVALIITEERVIFGLPQGIRFCFMCRFPEGRAEKDTVYTGHCTPSTRGSTDNSLSV